MVRMVPRTYRKKRWRVVFLWILGSFCLLMGSMMAGRLDRATGTSDTLFLLALLTSMMFFLITGLLWISASIALRKIEDD